MGKTKIEWSDETWNPVTGCSKVSPGCAHCYAETLTAKWAGKNAGFIGEHRPWTPENAAHNVTLWPDRLDQPLRWRKPRMVFVNSMSDLFHEQVPDEYIARVFAMMAAAPQHTFQVLTKRPERMKELLSHRLWPVLVDNEARDAGREPVLESRMATRLVLPNVWLGVSIENRRFVHRADLLRDTPAAVRFISAEPLLGPLSEDLTETEPNEWGSYNVIGWADGYDGPQLQLHDIDWLIVGGESGPGHRPIKDDWVRDLRDRCEASHETRPPGTAFFFKQWGGRTPKSGGRELDGRTWDEMPSARVPT